MLNIYTVIGFTMELLSNNMEKYDLKISTDGVNYQYIDQNITVNFLPGEDYTTYWFENPAQGRYWMMEFPDIRNLKGDIIGYL